MTDDIKKLLTDTLEALEHLHETGDTQVFDMYVAPVLIPELRMALNLPQE